MTDKLGVLLLEHAELSSTLNLEASSLPDGLPGKL